MRRIRIEALRM